MPYIESDVRKTSLYLTDAEQAKLEALARRTGQSQSALVRAAIAAYEVDDRDFAMLRSQEQGPGDSMADHLSRDLLAGFGE